jgi:hypothetical protein
MRKVKFQIQQELGAKPEISYGAKKKVITRAGLTEWLVHTLLLVRAEEYHRAACPATLTSQRPDQVEVIGQVCPNASRTARSTAGGRFTQITAALDLTNRLLTV